MPKKPWELLPVGRKRKVDPDVTRKREEAFAMDCMVAEARAYAGIRPAEPLSIDLFRVPKRLGLSQPIPDWDIPVIEGALR